MKQLKYSRQREAIKTFLMTRTDHPTAETIYENIREIYPHISLGTVYRNLNLLTDIGEIQRLSYGNESDHFDGNAKPHHHFLCTKCNTIYDLGIPDLSFINTLANSEFDGDIHGHQVHFYGFCKNCKNCD